VGRHRSTLPESLRNLDAIRAGDANLVHAAGVVVGWARNRLIHPPKKVGHAWPGSGELIDAWRIEMQWAELMILRLLGYQGRFGSRCITEGHAVGELELVPWAQPR